MLSKDCKSYFKAYLIFQQILISCMLSLLLVFKANWLKHLNARTVSLELERGWLQSSTCCQEKEERKQIPQRLKCIIPVNILMYACEWSKGKIPPETKVRREGETVMFIFICPLFGETCALPLTHSWIINAHIAKTDLFAITSDDGFVWKPLDLV